MHSLLCIILDQLAALISHFSKQNQPLVLNVLETLRRDVDRLYVEAIKNQDQLEQKISELQNRLNHDWENQYKNLQLQHQDLQKRIRESMPTIWPDEAKLVKSGLKIEAIKLYRQRTGLDLMASRNAIEAWAAKPQSDESQPEIFGLPF